MPHPRNLPNRETQICRHLVVHIQIDILVSYESVPNNLMCLIWWIWGCRIFTGICHRNTKTVNLQFSGAPCGILGKKNPFFFPASIASQYRQKWNFFKIKAVIWKVCKNTKTVVLRVSAAPFGILKKKIKMPGLFSKAHFNQMCAYCALSQALVICSTLQYSQEYWELRHIYK